MRLFSYNKFISKEKFIVSLTFSVEIFYGCKATSNVMLFINVTSLLFFINIIATNIKIIM